MPAQQQTSSRKIGLAHSAALGGTGLLQLLAGSDLELFEVATPAELAATGVSLLLLDPSLLHDAGLENWREALGDPECLILAEAGIIDAADLLLPAGLPPVDSGKIIKLALDRWAVQRENRQLRELLDKTEQDLNLLTEIGIALSAEKDLDRLLDKILAEAQNLACCDAASLFLVNRVEGKTPELVFKLTRNDSLQLDFTEQRMVFDRRSIAGYVAVTDQEVNIPNAYEISSDKPYSFNPDIDRTMGYRTVSLLTLPLRNYRGDVIGVLQFINRKIRRGLSLSNESEALRYVLPFEEEQSRILRALASQSAVAIENSVLLEDINKLFSGFVQAAVSAIEQRDPSTSGHSFRVADLCVDLAQRLPAARLPGYQSLRFSEAEIKELRYAALLHDFGKVGVREHILTKANKLPAGGFETIRSRVRLAQESVRRQLGEQLLQVWQSGGGDDQRAMLQAAAAAELERLDVFLQAVETANMPTVLEEGDFEHLQELRQYPFQSPDDNIEQLITEEEFKRLSIRRGSLSPEERDEIESHVVHTASFLRLIPWTPELARIPDLAEAHHEKLDGTGYPFGRRAEEIPVGSKIMAVCDIYDALTASDRPYKAAMPRDVAYRILQEEATAGKLDGGLVQVFIDANVTQVLEGKDYRGGGIGGGVANHPCDPELHDHEAH